MKSLKLILILFIMSIFFSSGLAQQKDWTILVYMIGADLESNGGAGSTDIAEMVAAGPTNNVNVIVLKGGANKAGWRTPSSWKIENGVEVPLSFTTTQTRMSTAQSVTEFVNWGTSTYPATSTALVFWNHGSDIRGYGNDENFQSKNLYVDAIQSAIDSTNFIKGGNKFDVLGFDACLMGTIEVQSMFKNHAFFFVGSEELEPGHGWDYEPIVKGMENGNNLYGDQIGRIILDGFKAQTIAESTTNITLGLVDLFYIPSLETKLQTLFTKITQDSKVKALQRARGKAEEYGKSTNNPVTSEDMVDLKDLLNKLRTSEPSLQPEIDSVLKVLNQAVIYYVNDQSRPHANGMSMYLPHSVLADTAETRYMVNEVYNYLTSFSAPVRNFVTNTYIPFAKADINPPNGQVVSFPAKRGDSAVYSAIQIDHDDDLEQVQVVLDEEFSGYPNEFILLGSTYPDTMIMNPDGTETYAYEWDGRWLGINGHPAYISDIHDYEVVDSMGNTNSFTRIHIPVVLNPGTVGERDLMLSYRYDEDFNSVLESIVPEKYGDSVMINPKERIQLQPGDQIQLLYEGFNMVTDEEFFILDPTAIFTIVNGNNDLKLEYDQLEVGDYHIGYVLMDHSHNDTIIFDDFVYSVIADGIDRGFIANNIAMYPNPASRGISIEYKDYVQGVFSVKVFDINGKVILNNSYSSQKAFVETASLQAGLYIVELTSGTKVFRDKLIIQH